VHLKIDTGMRRVGVHPGDAVALATQIKESSNLILEGVFTHLPISDCPEGEEFTKDQLARFIAVVDEIRNAVGEVPACAVDRRCPDRWDTDKRGAGSWEEDSREE